MSSPLSLWQELAFACLGLLSLAYGLFFRVWSGEGLGSDLLFALAVAAAATSVGFPSVFETSAHRVVEWSPLPDALAEADARAAALAALPRRLMDGALARLGFDLEEDVAEDDASGSAEDDDAGGASTAPARRPPGGPATEAVDSSSGSEAARAARAVDPGPVQEQAAGVFSAHIRPSIEGLVALLMRGGALVASAFAILLAIALRAVTSLARRLRRVTRRLDQLEQSIDPRPPIEASTEASAR